MNSINQTYFTPRRLTSDRLYMFDKFFSGYFNVGSSAMSKTIEKGMLRGRPFGDVMSLCMVTQTIHCDERYVVIKIANYLFVNVYLPCVGTCDRLMICDDIR